MDDFDFREHYKVNDIIFYLRVMPNLGVNEIIKCKIRTLYSDSFVAATEKAFPPTIYVNADSLKYVFKTEKEAQKESKKYTVKKVTIDRSEDD